MIRKGQLQDKTQIEALFLEMLRSINGKEPEKGYEPDYLLRFFSGGEDWICVEERDGRVVGYLSIEVHREEQDFLYLDDCCVAEAYRSQGIGTEFFRQAERYAQQLGISAIVLHVESSNTGAARLYERLGYRLLAEEGSRRKLLKTLPIL